MFYCYLVELLTYYDTIKFHGRWSSNREVTWGGGVESPSPPALPDSKKPSLFRVKIYNTFRKGQSFASYCYNSVIKSLFFALEGHLIPLTASSALNSFLFEVEKSVGSLNSKMILSPLSVLKATLPHIFKCSFGTSNVANRLLQFWQECGRKISNQSFMNLTSTGIFDKVIHKLIVRSTAKLKVFLLQQILLIVLMATLTVLLQPAKVLLMNYDLYLSGWGSNSWT